MTKDGKPTRAGLESEYTKLVRIASAKQGTDAKNIVRVIGDHLCGCEWEKITKPPFHSNIGYHSLFNAVSLLIIITTEGNEYYKELNETSLEIRNNGNIRY